MRPASALLSSLPALVAYAAFLWIGIPANAQSTALSVDLVLDESFFLPGEEIPVGVRISNLTGRPVTFGTTTNWLTFFVESKQGAIVTRLSPVPVSGEFTLESSKAGTKWWNLQPHFSFDKPGPHLVYAELRMPEWNQTLTSEPVTFTLQGASKLWEISFGVPPAPGQDTTEPEIRRYALQAATRLKERILYARVSDEEGARILKVVALDRYLSFSNPRQQLDARSQLHVIFQTGGSTYTYCIVSPDGELIARERHEIAGSRPRLLKNPDGTITVAGGRRRPSFTDIPPFEPPPPAIGTNTAATAITTTNAPATDTSKSTKPSRRRKKPAAAD